jgi:hypothetical protein
VSEPAKKPGKAIVKSDMATVRRRVNEVLRILLLGGDFEEVKQYAAAQSWNVCDRQLRRYIERAYKGLSEHTKRDQKQLLGRHLMQRRALYARAVKTNDLRAALAVLKDEAALQGLYEMVNAEQEEKHNQHSSIPKLDRFKRLLAARQKEDEQEIKLVEESSPWIYLPMPDVRWPEMILYTMATVHAAEQLDRASMVLMGLWRISFKDERSEFWEQMATIHAWNFSVQREGWDLFVEDLGVCGGWLENSSHRGTFLDLFSPQLHAVSPDRAEVERVMAEMGEPFDRLATPRDVARVHRRTLDEILAK